MISVRKTCRSKPIATKTGRDSVKAKTKVDKKPSQSLTTADKALQLAALQHRAKAIKGLKIEYISSADFKLRKLTQTILHDTDSNLIPMTQIKAASNTAPSYLARLYDTDLLSKEEESHLFRQMNYLRYRADRLRTKLSIVKPDAELMDRIQRLLQRSDSVKSRIIQANLRLVVSIAKKFVDAANQFDELVSDGNLSLIRAVEKFNYSLGNRFSTYATYAIRRNYFRTVVRSRKQRSRFLSDEDGLQAIPQSQLDEQINPVQLGQLQSSFGRMLERLNPREQVIIRQRFGFNLDEPKTFKELGQELGVCKERIRQIQARAMQKLRQFANDEQLLQWFDNQVQ